MSLTFRVPVGLALGLLLTLGVSPAFAELSLNANDVAPGSITSATPVGEFVLLAKSEKAVTVEALDKAKTAADGEVFNARIKLNGGGSAEFRSVKVTTPAPGRLTIYTNSSSKTDPRILKVVDEAGTVVGELTAPVDEESKAGSVTLDLTKAGTYLIFSSSGGINLYQVAVK